MRKRKLQISDRHIRHSIDTMVQGNPVKALIELITNSDDSYARLEEREVAVSGRIIVDVLERRGLEPSLIRVTDEAEGFSAEDLEMKLGRMGESTSGLEQGANVRGFFGDGLKEALLGLKVGGRITSIRDGKEVSAALAWEDQEPIFYPPEKPRTVTRARRRELGLRGNGTMVELEVAPDIRVPRHETLKTELSLHVALRDIVQNPDRELELRRLTPSGKPSQVEGVSYEDPVTDPEFKPVRLTGSVPGYRGATFTIELRRATDELSGPEDGMRRIGGLVVQSKRALVDITLFGHDNRPGTERFYGRLTCDYLYELLRQGDMVVTKYRAGLAKENPFVKKLAAEVDNMLAPYVQAEARRLQQKAPQEDAQTRKRLEDARRELNKIVQEELELSGDDGATDGAAPFRFQHRTYRVFLHEKKLVRLLVRSELLDKPATVTLELSEPGLSLNTQELLLDPSQSSDGVVAADAWLEGREVMEGGSLVARLGKHEALANVLVVEREQPQKPFAFEREAYRAPVAQWYDVALKIQVPQVLSTRSEVRFSVEQGNIKVRSPAETADPAMARAGWLTLHTQVQGHQVGQTDTLQASMEGHSASTQVTISTQHKPPEDKDKGGFIKEIRFDERQSPPQRTLFTPDGVITVYVNEPSIRRYLKQPTDRTQPAGQALLADLVLQAVCRFIAVRKADLVFSSNEMGSSTDAVLRQFDYLIKQHGERIHGIINPPGGAKAT